MRRAILAAGSGLSIVLFAAASLAQTVACHLTYGGETRVVEAAPASSPYVGTPSTIGSFFLFRIVFMREPADLARINLYTHADLDDAPIPLHQANHPYPVSNRERYGFTGLQRVYEPKRESELVYWCEIREAR